MKFLVSLVLFSISAIASNDLYELSIKLSVNGGPESSFGLTTQEGKTGLVESNTSLENTFLEVLATEGKIQGNTGILLKFKIGQILKDGTRKIISHPSILAKAGQEASIAVSDDNKSEPFTLKVIASRK